MKTLLHLISGIVLSSTAAHNPLPRAEDTRAILWQANGQLRVLEV